MNNLIGFFFFITFFVILLIWTKKDSQIRKLLIISFILRFLVTLSDHYNLINIPDSHGDANVFKANAINFSREYGFLIIFNFFTTDSYLLSRLISIFYTIFGESELMARSFSVVLGTACVSLVYNICLLIWDHRSAKKAAWVVTFFPTLVLYSALILREVYIIFLLLLALKSIVKFFKKKSIVCLIQIFVIFFILKFFHGPISIGVFVFIIFLIFKLIIEELENLTHFKINLLFFLFFFILLVPILLFLNNDLYIPYIGNFENLDSLDNIIFDLNFYFKGEASYPTFLKIENYDTNFFKIIKMIVKTIYFLFSPFIWDIKNFYQILGLFDTLLYFILIIYFIKNCKAILANPTTQFLTLLFIFYLFFYGISIANFGTSIRHKAKFVVILIILVAPKIHKFTMSVKKK